MPVEQITPLTDEEFEQWCRDELAVIQPTRHDLRVQALVLALKREIATDDELLAERNRILEALPCPTHGPCVPYVLHTISDMKLAAEHLDRALSTFNAAASAKLKHESERLTKIGFDLLYRVRILLSSRKDS